MMKKTKSFDCVAMKNRIQKKLMQEYEARKDEFPSYADFIRATVQENEWCRKQWARISQAPETSG